MPVQAVQELPLTSTNDLDRNACVDMFNASNEPNSANPTNFSNGGVVSSDWRIAPTFLDRTSLVDGGTRTFQLNVRLGF